nr:hypothetical protein BaRGS_003634 [Batillaria attramentaria]
MTGMREGLKGRVNMQLVLRPDFRYAHFRQAKNQARCHSVFQLPPSTLARNDGLEHEPRLRVEPEEESFFSSEGDVSLLPADADVDNSQPLLFKDMIRKAAYTQCSERQVLMGKVFEQLTDEERVFLNAAYLGDVGIVRQSLEESADSNLSVNCVDYMGRNALHLAIDSEKLDIIEILLDNLSFNCIEEALLHAISKGATKIVKIIIEHPNFMAGEDRLRRMGGGEAFFRTEEKSQFPPDITPLILAAHYNNHEIIQMFLSRNHTIEKPHPISCKCSDCVTKQNYDSLKRSRSRLNAYRALASPAYMALSSPDPIMTTFELRQEMMKLAEVEKEFKHKSEYLGMVEQCMNFACELMDLCRGTQEVEAVLSDSGEATERDILARLKMAIRYEEKKFVAHPNCQQHMTSIWYGSEMGFLQSLNGLMQFIYLILFIPIIPFLCVIYVFVPGEEKVQSLLKEKLRPASTLITHVQICLLWIECKQVYNSGARSYITDYYNTMDFGVLSMYLSSYVLRFFTEFKVSEADRYFNGTTLAKEYLMNHNYTFFDLHIARIKAQRESPHHYFMEASRFQWEPYDPEIVSDALFAIANVISFARTTWLMPAFEVLGPLQISLGRMIGDITRFMVLFTLVLFAFMVGLHNLYWYYGSQKIKMDLNGTLVSVHAAKAFQGLHKTFASLFWAMFGQVSISEIAIRHPLPDGGVASAADPPVNSFRAGLGGGEVRQCLALDCDKTKIYCSDSVGPGEDPSNAVYTDEKSSLTESSTALVETVGMYLFAVYHVVIIIVLINMLIAMMSHSFEDIQTDCDVEWKFARTKLWLNYMDDGSTLPVPFNMLPTPKSFFYGWQSCKELFCHVDGFMHGKARKQTFLKQRRETVCKTLELKPDETSYSDIMHRLVKRYLFKLERAKDEKENVKDGHTNLRGEEVEIWDPTVDGEPPPPVPETPSRIPYATPPIAEEEEEPQPERRTVPLATTLAIPQLDAIQRSQKLLDVRLQHLQANSKENNRMMDDVEFIRRLMTENQKALCNVVQALANIQGEIVNLAQCLRPTPRPQTQTQTARSTTATTTATPATSPTGILANANTHHLQQHHQQQPQLHHANAVTTSSVKHATAQSTTTSSSVTRKRGSGPDEDESKV